MSRLTCLNTRLHCERWTDPLRLTIARTSLVLARLTNKGWYRRSGLGDSSRLDSFWRLDWNPKVFGHTRLEADMEGLEWEVRVLLVGLLRGELGF